MNPILILIVILALIAIWFLLSSMYKPLGKFVSRIFDDTRKAMEDEDDIKDKKHF